MKKIIILIIFSTLLFSNTINTETRENRLNYINKLINKELQIYNFSKKYILFTADNNITKNKLSTFFQLDNNFWKGLTQSIDIKLNNSTLEISNLLTNKNNIIDKQIKNIYKLTNKNYNSYLYNNKNYIILSTKFKKILNFSNNLNKNNFFIDNYLINDNDVSLINKIELKFNGSEYILNKYDNNSSIWKKIGTLNLYNNKDAITVSDINDLTPFISLKNIKKILIKNNQAIEMKYINNQWSEVKNNINSSIDNNNSINNIFNKNIYEASCFINNFQLNDIIKLPINIEEYINHSFNITKKEFNNQYDYWIDDTEQYLFLENKIDLNYIQQNNLLPNLNYIYICNDNKKSYTLIKKITLENNPYFVYIINNKEQLSNILHKLDINDKIYLKSIYKYFEYKGNNIFNEIYNNNNGIINTETKYILGVGSKEVFSTSILDNNKTYLTTKENCSFYKNCSGTNGLYNGIIENGLYTWNVYNNQLIDLKKSSLYNGFINKYSNFMNNNIIYTKILDNNNNICYKDNNNNFYYINGMKIENDFIYNNQLNFPIDYYNCSSNNKILYSNNMKYGDMNTSYTGKYILLNNIKDLQKIDLTNFNLPIALNINNERQLFKKFNNEFYSYKYVIGLTDRHSLEYISDNNERQYYTFNLGTDILSNNGLYNNDFKLYSWGYNINDNNNINGFIDILNYSNIYDAYQNLNNINLNVKIRDKIYIKKSITTINGNTFNCLTYHNNYYNINNKIIPNNYFNNNLLEVPDNYNCKNILIEDNNNTSYIELNNLKDLTDLDVQQNYIINNLIYKVYMKNNIIVNNNNNDYYIVLGNRYNFDINNFNNIKNNYNFNNKVYTLYIDFNNNNDYKKYILNNDYLYEWTIKNTPYSINNLLNEKKYRSCYEAYTYYGINDEYVNIIDNNNKMVKVKCVDNGKTLLDLNTLLSYLKIVTYQGQNTLNPKTGKMTLYSNFINVYLYYFDLPLNFSSYDIDIVFPNNHTLNWNSNFTMNNAQNFMNNLTDNSTNYTTFGIIKGDNSIFNDTIISDNNNNKFHKLNSHISNNIILIEALNINYDTTADYIDILPNAKIILYP